MAEWLIPLFTLTALEIVLGIDNIIFIAIVASKLPPEQRKRARQLGLMLALGSRLLLLFTLTFIMGLKEPLFTLGDWLPLSDEAREVTGKDLIMLLGGMFLIAKSTHEIHEKLEGQAHSDGEQQAGVARATFSVVITQIILIDIIFSLDSVITAVGMVKPEMLWVMITAMVISVGVMLMFAGRVSDFVERHPTMKMLALSFLILIGVLLVAEGTGQHIDRGYVYFAMAFAVGVELLNLNLRKKAEPVSLHGKQMPK